jgi:hypothetical protein
MGYIEFSLLKIRRIRVSVINHDHIYEKKKMNEIH